MASFFERVYDGGTLVSAFLALAMLGLGTVDSRGPIEYPGLRVSVSPGAVQSVGYSFRDECAKPGGWGAKWIGVASSGSESTVRLYRKEFQLRAGLKRARVWVSADIGYRLYVNGRLVGRGPADVGRDYDREEQGPQWLYDCRDLSGVLHAGVNTICAEVFSEGFVSRATRGKHGLLLEGLVEFGDGSRSSLVTDSSWRGSELSGWRGGQVDLAGEPVGWLGAGFDDRSWGPCLELADVWGPLAASEIPPQMEARYPLLRASLGEVALPVRKGRLGAVRVERNSALVLTYDRVIAAYPSFKINGARGVTLRVVPGERAGQSSRVMTLKLRDGVQTFEYPFYDSFSSLRLEFSGVSDGRKVEVLDAGANFTSMPVSYRGSFSCSDAHLNELWASCRWLTQICMQDHHLDSPNHQEPICDPGDYLIESHANYLAFGAPWLARQDLRKFGLLLKDLKYRNFHTSYSLLWLQMLLTYYDYTGDASLVKELAPEVNGLLDTFAGWTGKNGLISEAPNYMFMDWVTIAGFECHHPPAVIGQGYMTAFYYRALLDGIRVAQVTGDGSRAERYGMLRDSVAEAFNRELWDSSKGLYRDGKPGESSVPAYQWMPSDRDIETFSPHVNTLAVLYDLAPVSRQGAIMDRVMGMTPMNYQRYFTYFVLEALKHSGRFGAHARGLMDLWKIQPDTQTFFEMWDQGDLSHAWGGAPLIQMSETVLGVRPLTPGFERFSIRPDVFGLKWAEGTAPTPRGVITVKWRVVSRRFELLAVVPARCEAEVELPGSVGPHLVWKAGRHLASVAFSG